MSAIATGHACTPISDQKSGFWPRKFFAIYSDVGPDLPFTNMLSVRTASVAKRYARLNASSSNVRLETLESGRPHVNASKGKALGFKEPHLQLIDELR